MSVVQNHPRKLAAGAGLSAAAMAVAVMLIGGFEGKRNWTYFDIVSVKTACYGHTGPDVKVGAHYTDAECKTQLAEDIRKHYDGMTACAPMDAIPDPSRVAFLSLTFNIGVSAFCRSSIPGKLRAGNLAAACATLSKYDMAGGRHVKGLTTRRQAERKLCEQGL